MSGLTICLQHMYSTRCGQNFGQVSRARCVLGDTHLMRAMELVRRVQNWDASVPAIRLSRISGTYAWAGPRINRRDTSAACPRQAKEIQRRRRGSRSEICSIQHDTEAHSSNLYQTQNTTPVENMIRLSQTEGFKRASRLLIDETAPFALSNLGFSH